MSSNFPSPFATTLESLSGSGTPTGKYAAVGSDGFGQVVVDCDAANNFFELALTEDITTWTFTNRPADGTYKDLFIAVTQDAATPYTAVSPGDVTAEAAWVNSLTLASLELLGLRVIGAGGPIVLLYSGVFV